MSLEILPRLIIHHGPGQAFPFYPTRNILDLHSQGKRNKEESHHASKRPSLNIITIVDSGHITSNIHDCADRSAIYRKQTVLNTGKTDQLQTAAVSIVHSRCFQVLVTKYTY
jgi:hypothetical protein